MTFSSGLAGLFLAVGCFGLGGLPIIGWLVRGLTQQQLSELGTGNISVSAAFYHGGTAIGLLAVSSEAAKGIGAVLLARFLFPGLPVWEIVALIALVVGRYALSRGAGTTNVVWGYVVHDWRISLIIFLVAGGLFALMRQRQVMRLFVLILMPILEGFLGASAGAIAAATCLSLLIAWIYTQIPDDLALAANKPSSNAGKMFRFLQGQDGVTSLDESPNAQWMGQKAATLAELKQAGYPVPPGWVLAKAGTVRSLLDRLTSAQDDPWSQTWIVRSSALDEDRDDTSAAGQYQSIPNVTTPDELAQAIQQCRASYQRAGAAQYRRDRGLRDQSGMALLIQEQIEGQYAGVAFSRDPVDPGEAVLVEAIAGNADQVVSGQVTPEQFRITVDNAALAAREPSEVAHWEPLPPPISSNSSIPPAVVQRVAELTRHLELRYHGIPQDIEWTFDGQRLWLLQTRPITTLTPIWTRKIAAEVIPGVIRPLTWSINRPLTCGVWGQIFAIVLGEQAQGLDFNATATLHYSRAYFNATLLGQIFRRMGLPPESLEFLTMGTKFSRPPIKSTVKNLPGLTRLLKREWTLIQDFERDYTKQFAPTLAQLSQQAAANLSTTDLCHRTAAILSVLEQVTYYSILAPLSFALRQALLQVEDTDLDQSQLPEVASVQAVKHLAHQARRQYPQLLIEREVPLTEAELFARIGADPNGQPLLQELDSILDRYSYLSEVGTDIAVPTWRENPHPMRELFVQFLQATEPPATPALKTSGNGNTWQQRQVQRRLNLKGQVATVYLQLLAELRWSLLALEEQAIAHYILHQPGDIFFLIYEEVQRWLAEPQTAPAQTIQALVKERQSQFETAQKQPTVPFIVYGNNPPPDPTASLVPVVSQAGLWQGIGASVGQVQGTVKVFQTLQTSLTIAPNTIVVVPYTDAGWAPILARAAGLVAEVGGRLSHGAIVAREYNIPAVMNIAHATQLFQDGQTIRIDGRAGTVEVVEPL